MSSRRATGKSPSRIVAVENKLTKSSSSSSTSTTSNIATSTDVFVEAKPVSRKSVIERTLTACIMTAAYMLMLMAGHFYCILVGVMTQVELFRELCNVRYIPAKERSMPYFRTLQWGWFFTAMGWVYGERLNVFFGEHQDEFGHLLPFTSKTAWVVFFCYCVLFVASVLTFKADMIKFQISQYVWTIVIICLVVLQCKFFVSYTLKGLFWFWFPMATVVMNDVSAYFCGITWGKRYIKRPFISLSPNKSWEGFIGAFFLTLLFSFFFPRLLANFTWLTCEAKGIYLSPFPDALICDPHWVFVAREYALPTAFSYFGIEKLTLLPIQLHGLAYGFFASAIAPFGGFFASAIKRAYDLKDFDTMFPGHGGLMDRMDCQLIMMAFTSFHYRYFIDPYAPTVANILASIATLSRSDQEMVAALVTAQLSKLAV